MSTKNLARTVIEGGRARYNRWERRHSNAQHRAHERQVESALLMTTELDDVVFPHRKKVSRGFSDKLAPAERWLTSQVGRPWDRVRAELFERFDSRTTAGRHILYDHLLPSVENRGSPFRPEFTVDRHGILRYKPKQRLRRTLPAGGPPKVPAAFVAWLQGRLVGQRGEILFWFTPKSPGLFRQHRRLSEPELRLWLGQPLWLRKQFDVFSPAVGKRT